MNATWEALWGLEKGEGLGCFLFLGSQSPGLYIRHQFYGPSITSERSLSQISDDYRDIRELEYGAGSKCIEQRVMKE
jgi:hypothetical protein